MTFSGLLHGTVVWRFCRWFGGALSVGHCRSCVVDFVSVALRRITTGVSYVGFVLGVFIFGFNFVAIHNNVTADVIRLLLEADPTVTSLPDGDENQGSLHILLRQQRNHRDILPLVDSFLLAHPTALRSRTTMGAFRSIQLSINRRSWILSVT